MRWRLSARPVLDTDLMEVDRADAQRRAAAESVVAAVVVREPRGAPSLSRSSHVSAGNLVSAPRARLRASRRGGWCQRGGYSTRDGSHAVATLVSGKVDMAHDTEQTRTEGAGGFGFASIGTTRVESVRFSEASGNQYRGVAQLVVVAGTSLSQYR